MEKDNKLSFDDALAKAEAIIRELEGASALSMEVYRKKASEARQYLTICREQIAKIETEMELEHED